MVSVSIGGWGIPLKADIGLNLNFYPSKKHQTFYMSVVPKDILCGKVLRVLFSSDQAQIFYTPALGFSQSGAYYEITVLLCQEIGLLITHSSEYVIRVANNVVIKYGCQRIELTQVTGRNYRKQYLYRVAHKKVSTFIKLYNSAVKSRGNLFLVSF